MRVEDWGLFEFLLVLLEVLGMLSVGTGVGVVDSQFWKISMKRIKSIVANAKVMMAFFIHSHILSMRDFENVRNIIKRRKTSVLLKRCWNI